MFVFFIVGIRFLIPVNVYLDTQIVNSGYLEAEMLNKLDLTGAISKIQYGGTPPCGKNWEFSVNIPHARQKLYAKFRVYSFHIELGRSLLILAGSLGCFCPRPK